LIPFFANSLIYLIISNPLGSPFGLLSPMSPEWYYFPWAGASQIKIAYRALAYQFSFNASYNPPATSSGKSPPPRAGVLEMKDLMRSTSSVNDILVIRFSLSQWSRYPMNEILTFVFACSFLTNSMIYLSSFLAALIQLDMLEVQSIMNIRSKSVFLKNFYSYGLNNMKSWWASWRRIWSSWLFSS
jgi:hypothetical protein